jgi:hypothetical protein
MEGQSPYGFLTRFPSYTYFINLGERLFQYFKAPRNWIPCRFEGYSTHSDHATISGGVPHPAPKELSLYRLRIPSEVEKSKYVKIIIP